MMKISLQYAQDMKDLFARLTAREVADLLTNTMKDNVFEYMSVQRHFEKQEDGSSKAIHTMRFSPLRVSVYMKDAE